MSETNPWYMQKQYTIELRGDNFGDGSNMKALVLRTMQDLAAKAGAYGDKVQAYAFSDDFFTGHETIGEIK